MNYPYSHRLISFTAILFLVGCGGGASDLPGLVPVSGTVTLDGAPLADAQLEFQPQGVENGAPSYATTDDSGHYVLKFGPGKYEGAMTGKHQVRITKFEPDPKNDDPGVTINTLPARYNSNTELTAEIGTEDVDDLNFKLEK